MHCVNAICSSNTFCFSLKFLCFDSPLMCFLFCLIIWMGSVNWMSVCVLDVISVKLINFQCGFIYFIISFYMSIILELIWIGYRSSFDGLIAPPSPSSSFSSSWFCHGHCRCCCWCCCSCCAIIVVTSYVTNCIVCEQANGCTSSLHLLSFFLFHSFSFSPQISNSVQFYE